MSSKADRPYGHFPVEGDEFDLPPAPPERVRLRDRILGTGRKRRIRVTATALGVLLILAGMVGASQPLPKVIPPRPTPRPTPTVAEIYQQVAPSVVAIRRLTDANNILGAGVVVDEMAHILTALHVVGDLPRVVVRFADGFEAEAQVVATLPARDIALLRPFAPPPLVVPAVLGDQRRSPVGSEVFVIGHPFGLGGSYTAGIVSGLERTARTQTGLTLTRLIQFDAAVNPGNSGGPLIDRRGEVIGIVTAAVNPSGQRAFAGVGFAVPIDQAGGALGIPID